MENNQDKLKEELIRFIKENDKSMVNTDLDNFSITALTILKTEIEIRLIQNKDNKFNGHGN